METKLLAAQREVTKFKTKVDSVYGDMEQIGQQLDKYDEVFAKLNQIREQTEKEPF